MTIIFLFIIFGFLFLLSFIIILSRNIIYSILSLILSAFFVALLLIILGFEFLAYLILMVYIGAVVILFLFTLITIKLDFTNYNENEKVINRNHGIIYSLIYFKLITYFYFMAYTSFNIEFLSYSNIWLINLIKYKCYDIALYGNSMYYYFSVYTILSAILLLVGMVGSIAILRIELRHN